MKTTAFVLLFAIVVSVSASACAPAATPVPVTPAVQVPTAAPPTATSVPPATATAALTSTSASQPPLRSRSGLAYDPQADRLILFGGLNGHFNPVFDTWAYDPATRQWTQMHPAQSPQGVGQMVYDGRAGRVIFYAYATKDTTGNHLWDIAPFGETWEYDFKTDTWTNRQAANTPVGLAFASLAYDAESDRTILFGGADCTKGDKQSIPLVDGTWAYDYAANAWTKLNPKASPSGRADAAMTYDAAADRAILFGGDVGNWSDAEGAYKMVNDTWAFDFHTTTWSELKPADPPSVRSGSALVYDPQTQRDFLFGGATMANAFNDTWAYDVKSNTWKDLSPNGYIMPMTGHGLVAIPTTREILAIGGGRDTPQTTQAYMLYDPATNQWQSISVKH